MNYAVLSWRGCLRANTRTVRKGLNLTRGSLYIVRFKAYQCGRITCTLLRNKTKWRLTDLYVDGSVLLSREGTTQGDPLAMPMYALATVPLIAKLSEVDSVSQTWYADDASACGKLPDVYNWWNLLAKQVQEVCLLSVTNQEVPLFASKSSSCSTVNMLTMIVFPFL